MRMRKIPWAVEYLEQAQCRIKVPEQYKGKWKQFLDTEVLHVEIGCGKGNYSLGMSKLYPQEGFVAIEKNDSAAGVAAKKYDTDTEKGKLCLIRGDAQALNEWFDKQEIDVIHLNFSDPWPKERHAKRRLTSCQFLERYDKILAPEGTVEFKTDNRPLFEFSLEEVKEAGWFLDASTFDLHHDAKLMEGNVMTEYEEKFSRAGNPIHKMIIHR